MEILHIFGFVIMAGSIAMLDFRLLGFGPKLPVKELANFLLPWTWLGFAMSLFAGGTLFIVKAPEWIVMPIFQIKIVLVSSAALMQPFFITEFTDILTTGILTQSRLGKPKQVRFSLY